MDEPCASALAGGENLNDRMGFAMPARVQNDSFVNKRHNLHIGGGRAETLTLSEFSGQIYSKLRLNLIASYMPHDIAFRLTPDPEGML